MSLLSRVNNASIVSSSSQQARSGYLIEMLPADTPDSVTIVPTVGRIVSSPSLVLKRHFLKANTDVRSASFRSRDLERLLAQTPRDGCVDHLALCSLRDLRWLGF